MAPTCSNCGATEFVWANELKTGMTGSGLSLRPRGEVPLGTRICRGCGHADLFLRDLDILNKPHLWKPGEFIPIQGKPSPARALAEPTPAPPPVAPRPAPIAPVPLATSSWEPTAPVAPPPPPPMEPAPEPPGMGEPDGSSSSRAKTAKRRAVKAKPEGS